MNYLKGKEYSSIQANEKLHKETYIYVYYLGKRKIADKNFQGGQETVKYQTPVKQEVGSRTARSPRMVVQKNQPEWRS